MITARVCLSHFEKTFITESEKKNIESEQFLIMFLLTYPILKYPFRKNEVIFSKRLSFELLQIG